MNSFIVSQWYKYRKDLLNFYKSNIFGTQNDPEEMRNLVEQIPHTPLCQECKGAKGYCDVCPSKDGDIIEEYEGKSYFDIAESLIKNLLTFVVNRGEDSLGLSLEDVTYANDDIYCFDAIYLLRDKDGDLWTMKIFYGSYDTAVPIPAESKQEWLTTLMHFSLNMVQSISHIGGNVSQTLMVFHDEVSECGIQCIVSLQDLKKMTGYDQYKIYSELKGLSYNSLKPLFQFMSKGQISDIQDILSEDDVDGDLIKEIFTTGYSPFISAFISSRNAEKLFNKLSEFNLKGYMAICQKKVALDRGLTTAIDCSRHTEENTYEWIDRVEKEANIHPYFIAVGDSLDALMKNIHKLSKES